MIVLIKIKKSFRREDYISQLAAARVDALSDSFHSIFYIN